MVACSAVSLENANYSGPHCIFEHICPREPLIESCIMLALAFSLGAMVPRVLGAIDRW